MPRLIPFTAAALIAACAMPVLAHEPDAPAKAESKETRSLKVGDPAPALSIDKWVKGEPVTAFEKGRVYVVEFWATWCGPCIQSMPHLSEIQKDYKDKVTIIGVTSKDKRNSLDKVEDMVKTKADGMAYTVAWDKARSTDAAYMEASGQQGIPCSFIVDQQGKVAYIGHPSSLDFVLRRVVDGKWDYTEGPKALRGVMAERKAILEKAEDDPKAALTAFNAFVTKYPEMSKGMEDLRFQLLVEAGETAEASRLGAGVVDRLVAQKDVESLNQFAWTIVDPKGDSKFKDYDLALRAAQKGVEFSESKNAAILDTLARCYFVKGDRQKAIELQKKAVAAAPEDLKEEIEGTLREYEAGSN